MLEKYRRKGIGGKLMDVAERIASAYSDTVYLGVGVPLLRVVFQAGMPA